MRSKWIVTVWMLMVLGLVSCGPAGAGPVRIEKKTETLKQGEEEAVIHTPVLEGIEDPALVKRVQESFAAGVKEATGFSPEEWKVEEGPGWLDEIDYQVTYNSHQLLSVAYTISGTGAYPDHMEAYIVVDMETGRRLTAKDLFKSASLAELASKVDRMRSAEVEKTFQEHRAHPKEIGITEEDLALPLGRARESRFGVEDLDRFRLDDKGVTFIYDFGFPHVNEALEPAGEYFLSWEELRPYMEPEGPLSRVVG